MLDWENYNDNNLLDLQGEYLQYNPFDNNETIENNAIIASIEYGKYLSEATGKKIIRRLMNYSEATKIEDGSDLRMKNILNGKWSEENISNPITQGYLYWWQGVRPVLEIN